jgi:membrane protein implicated in regulation of membrane protease activity
VSAWIWWIVVAAAFGIGEMLTGGFYLVPFALGAFGGVIAGAIGAGTVIQIIVFLAASAAASGIVRPIARRHVAMPPQIRTGTAALVGSSALVIDRVGAHEGSVRIGGEVWTARPYMEGEVMESGAQVQVVEIRGATALVAE